MASERETLARDVDPQETLDRLDYLGGGAVRTLDLDGRRDLRLAAQLIRDQIEMLAEYDAAPVTDARIWDGVRDAIEKRLRDEEIGEPYREFANELARIALGEREP